MGNGGKHGKWENKIWEIGKIYGKWGNELWEIGNEILEMGK